MKNFCQSKIKFLKRQKKIIYWMVRYFSKISEVSKFKKNLYIRCQNQVSGYDDIDDLRLALFLKLKGKNFWNNSKKLIIFNRNAYILRDLYCHSLEEYSKIYDVYFITSDLFISKEIIKTFRSYVFKKNLSDFIVIRNNVSSVLFNKNLNNLIGNIKNSSYYVLTPIPANILDFNFLKKVQYDKNIIITWFDNIKIDINHLNYQKIQVQENESNISNFWIFLIIISLTKIINYQNLILTKHFGKKKIFSFVLIILLKNL